MRKLAGLIKDKGDDFVMPLRKLKTIPDMTAQMWRGMGEGGGVTRGILSLLHGWLDFLVIKGAGREVIFHFSSAPLKHQAVEQVG